MHITLTDPNLLFLLYIEMFLYFGYHRDLILIYKIICFSGTLIG